MRIPRLHIENPLAEGQRLQLPPESARHAVQVLRLQAGAAVRLFDGRGGEYAATVLGAGRRGLELEVGAHAPRECESALEICLLQGISRGERMDYTIQKAVELGVSTIWPLACERSTVRLQGDRAHRRLQHWQRVAIAACEQCGRNRIPAIEAVRSLPEALGALSPGGMKLTLAPDAPDALAGLQPAGPVRLLVGPEGGLSPSERQCAARAGFRPAALGPRVLRTETAALVALAVLQARGGDLA